MKLENFVKLVGGELLNTPSISSFIDISHEVKKSHRGDLFILKNHDDQTMAHEHGVYAFLVQTRPSYIDAEVAYIMVDSLEDALVKYFRFLLTQMKLSYVYMPTYIYSILVHIQKNENLILVENTISSLLFAIKHYTPQSILLSDNKTLISTLSVNTYDVLLAQENYTLSTQTLFSSSFTYENTHYDDIKISPIFLPYLCSIISFLEDKHLPFYLDKLPLKDTFEPHFIDNNFVLKDYGKSDKVLILDKIENIDFTLAYFQKSTTWAQTIVYMPKAYKKKLPHAPNLIFYEPNHDILLVKEKTFSFALIYGTPDILSSLVQHKTTAPTLF